MAKRTKGLPFEPHFLEKNGDPYEGLTWVRRNCEILDREGLVVFRQDHVEAPSHWSSLAVEVAASKFFRRRGVPRRIAKDGREDSVRQMIDRVVDFIAEGGARLGYFATRADRDVFTSELKFLCVRQMAAFNSPVWFNAGLYSAYGIKGSAQLWRFDEKIKKCVLQPSAYEFPQTSACFILSVADDLDAIFELARNEAKIFKFGSGSGANFSPLRGRGEPLESGGQSSGVLAFLEVLDRGAGATKSGGTTRRAAKMVILDVDHPEIIPFIRWKAREEEKALALIRAGFSGGLDGEAYRTVSGQNSNNSVRVTDRFMRAVLADGHWWTKFRVGGKNCEKLKAREIWREMAEAAWRSADPGVQFHDTINRWHTCPTAGEIVASNPCSEYMFLGDSACNLASLNLAQFLEGERWDFEGFQYAARLLFVAQEILVALSAYPTPLVAKNSHHYRPLGLGFANLGGFLMRLGIPYDSEESRALASRITALMTGVAYRTSAELAKAKGAFACYRKNKSAMIHVIKLHQKALAKMPKSSSVMTREIEGAARIAWQEALADGERYGYRNAQASVLAPTGTIGLLMDCDTTGIEPEFALLKSKKMVGGGERKMVNRAVDEGLKVLGYDESRRTRLLARLEAEGTFEDDPLLRPAHRAVFDCAQRLKPNGRFLSPAAHLQMMSAAQPFLSGAISKTVNLPQESTPEEIEEIHLSAWRLGLKSIAIYRDRAKQVQPLSALVGADLDPRCSACGCKVVRTGNCFKCLNCGHSESCG